MLSQFEPTSPSATPQPARPGWGLGAALAALFISLASAEIGGALIIKLSGASQAQLSLGLEVVAYQFFVLGIALSVLFLSLLQGRFDPAAIGFRFPGWETIFRSMAAVIPLFLGVALLTLLFNTLLPGYHLQGNAKQELLPGGQKHLPLAIEVIAFFWAAVEAPLAEETLFRGILYAGIRNFLARRVMERWAVFGAALLSGIAFGVLHGQPHTLPILVFMGIVLAYVFEHTRSIYASGVVHGLTNAIAVLSVFQLT